MNRKISRSSAEQMIKLQTTQARQVSCFSTQFFIYVFQTGQLIVLIKLWRLVSKIEIINKQNEIINRSQ